MSLQTLLGLSAWSACSSTLHVPYEGFLTLLPFPFVSPLSLLFPPPPSPPPLLLSLLFGVFESSDYRHVLSFGGPRGLRSRQREKIKKIYSAPSTKAPLTITTGDKLLNINKRLSRHKRSEDG